MSWSTYLPDDRLRWTEGHDSTPIWPSEPDLEIIRQTALSVIIDGGVEEKRKDDLIAVDFLADGARHKIYQVTNPSWTASYLLRVAVPLDARLKMESEMATMEFVRRRTKIPVPKPVAWSSSASNPLGFEWCLLENAPGVELRQVWRKMPWEGKLRVVDQLAGIMSQLWSDVNKFDEIGSLYFDDSKPREGGVTQPFTTASEFSASGFCIGTSVDPAFFSGRRRYIKSDRGPFESSSAWVTALLEVEWEVLKTAKILLSSKSDMSDALKEEDWDHVMQEEIGLDQDDLKDFDEIENAYHSYKNLLPGVFVGQDPFSLYHEDLRSANIIINPSTYDITGVIDWEQATTIPDWYGIDYPACLRGQDPFDEQDGQTIPVTYDSEDEEYNAVTVSARDRRDGLILRKRFDEAMKKLGRENWNHKSTLDKLKSNFLEGVADLGDVHASKRTLKQIRESFDRHYLFAKLRRAEILDLTPGLQIPAVEQIAQHNGPTFSGISKDPTGPIGRQQTYMTNEKTGVGRQRGHVAQ